MLCGPLYRSYHIQNSEMVPFPQHPQKAIHNKQHHSCEEELCSKITLSWVLV
jgi:hypothetical protein